MPHIYVDGASDGIAFYERAFGLVELFRIARPDGKILERTREWSKWRARTVASVPLFLLTVALLRLLLA